MLIEIWHNHIQTFSEVDFSLVCNCNLLNCGLETKKNLFTAVYAQSNKAIWNILGWKERGKPVKILGIDTN